MFGLQQTQHVSLEKIPKSQMAFHVFLWFVLKRVLCFVLIFVSVSFSSPDEILQ